MKLISKIISSYSRVQIKNQNRWITPEVLNVYLKDPSLAFLNWNEVGFSEEGRSIKRTQIGNGPIRILIWSQMHGNEATGTLAMLELLKLVGFYPEHFKDWLEKVTLFFIPMLNPDGSARFTRRNGLLIDNNRDLLKQTAAETQCLVNEVEELHPHIAVNLHDQRDIFGASKAKPATVSFLAPSYNMAREINESRTKCMQLIAGMNNIIQAEIPDCVGRYSDEFYPTAVGEYVQKKDIPCILIESGAALGDENREVARKMNVISVLNLMEQLASGGWKNQNTAEYYAIPENSINFFNIIVSNVRFSKSVIADVGLLKKQFVENDRLQEVYEVTEIGDLQFKHAFEELDAKENIFEGALTLNNIAEFSIVSAGLIFKNGKRILE